MTDRIKALIDGLSRQEESQAREGKAGDPQLSALCQFLAQSDLTDSKVIVDFGAGNGVLPEYMARIWSDTRASPEYWAVDLSNMLDQLSLPRRIHNNSRKYTLDEFYAEALPKDASRI